MTLEIIIKYIHFLCIFLIVGALVGEHLLLKARLTRREITRLAKLDSVYGISVIVLLAAGFSLWFWAGPKPADYYSSNWIFLTKLGLFGAVGLLSAYPTMFFLRQRKGDPDDVIELPASIPWLIRAELFLLFLMPLLATAMAQGMGTG